MQKRMNYFTIRTQVNNPFWSYLSISILAREVHKEKIFPFFLLADNSFCFSLIFNTLVSEIWNWHYKFFLSILQDLETPLKFIHEGSIGIIIQNAEAILMWNIIIKLASNQVTWFLPLHSLPEAALSKVCFSVKVYFITFSPPTSQGIQAWCLINFFYMFFSFFKLYICSA